MYRLVRCPRWLDASSPTKHASLQHSCRSGFVSDKTNPRLHKPHRRHNHRKMPSSARKRTANLESRRRTQRRSTERRKELATRCIPTSVLNVKRSEAIDAFSTQRWLVHHKSVPLQGLPPVNVGFKAVIQKSSRDETPSFA